MKCIRHECDNEATTAVEWPCPATCPDNHDPLNVCAEHEEEAIEWVAIEVAG